METTMTLIYDGQKELIKAKGFKTVEELKSWQKETFENFAELKVGRSCKILENGYIKVSDSMFDKINGKYKIVTNF